MDGFSPIPGKCKYWREALHPDDEWDMRIKRETRRVQCTCFVEGYQWEYIFVEVPPDCPSKRTCRYYIRHE